MDKKKLQEMIGQVEKLLAMPGLDESQRKAYAAQIQLFKSKIVDMSILDLFTRANKVGMGELVALRMMSNELLKNPASPPDKQLAFVHKAASVMKAFLAAA